MIKPLRLQLLTLSAILSFTAFAQEPDYISLLETKMENEIASSINPYYRLHCQSIIAVLNMQESISSTQQNQAKLIYERFTNEDASISSAEIANYENRSWQFIMAWESENDGETSFTWLKLPKDWNPEEEYPLYVQLHGYWDVADHSMEYLSYPFQSQSSSTAFEDGYRISPWGRGNYWYRDFAEEDIWECIAAIKQHFKINARRQYLLGHSMGGYGTWHIAHQSPDTWAAIGLHAAAIWYNGESEISESVASSLKNVPTYFVCGTVDQNLRYNDRAYKLLQNAGNVNLEFVTFEGGHEYRGQDVEAMYLWLKDFTNEDLTTTIFSEQEKNKSLLDIYPVPTSDFLEITYTVGEASEIELSLYNCEGQLIEYLAKRSVSVGTHHIVHDFTTEYNGIYFLNLKTNQQVITKKILVNR